jgi:hypothetical protein
MATWACTICGASLPIFDDEDIEQTNFWTRNFNTRHAACA